MKAKIREEETIDPQPHLNTLKIMTYNVLAQALVRRDQYPTNGNSIKWAVRFPALIEELQTYNPDVVCLQEVDKQQDEKWKELLSKDLDMEMVYGNVDTKKHGLIVAFKRSQFQNLASNIFEYDLVKKSIPLQTPTGNCGLVVALRSCLNKQIFVIGTTHMYWHPNACYTRARQVVVLCNEVYKLALNFETKNIIIAGDFNSGPPYPGCKFIRNEMRFDEDDITRIRKSASTEYFGASDSPLETQSRTCIQDVDSAVSGLVRESEEVRRLTNDKGIFRLKSCYPFDIPYTNWTDNFRDCIDYIFISSGFKVAKLLKLPTIEELGPEPSSIPRMVDGDRGYPSDHVPLMATLEY